MNKPIGRALALQGVMSVLIHKKSLSAFNFSNDSFATNLTYTSLRYYHYLVKVINNLLIKDFDKKDVDIFCILVTASAELLYTRSKPYAVINEWVNLTNKQWSKSVVNAILRKINTNSSIIKANTDHSHPIWLYKKIFKSYPDNILEIVKANNTPASMSIRVDTDIMKYSDELSSKDISHKVYSNRAIILEHGVSVECLPHFFKGGVYVQDVSAIEAVECLNVKEGDTVLDVCSAPGGKTTHLASLTKQPVVSIELSKDRIKILEENLRRMKCKNVEILCDDATNVTLSQTFDKVFVDVPCSATGIIRRHPDIKLLRKKTDIANVVRMQKNILDNIWQYVKPGGELVYASCSILAEENECQIENFLVSHPNSRALPIDSTTEGMYGKQILPSNIQDGFYYAKLVKLG